MESTVACEILLLIITSLGILIGFLLIFLQFIPDRKRKINDILIAKQLELLLQSFTANDNEEKIKEKIEEKLKETGISIIQKILDNVKISIKISRFEISLISINLIIFSYTVLLFLSSIIYYVLLKNMVGNNFNEIMIYIIIILTIIDYILLIPMIYLSCIKDYKIKK